VKILNALVLILWKLFRPVLLILAFVPYVIWHSWKHPEVWAKHREEIEERQRLAKAIK
jgi:hypothetical protein